MARSPLTNTVIPADPSNYSPAYYRKGVDGVCLHHMAGVLTARTCGNIFAGANRGGSAHYGVGSDLAIGAYVPEECVAWHAGNWDANCRYLSIEMANSRTGGDWPVSEAVYNRTAELLADISKRYGLGRYTPGQNLVWHSMFCVTECPGDYTRARVQHIADLANEIIAKGEEMAKPTLIWTRLPETKRYKTLLEPTMLWNFGHIRCEDRKEVKRFSKGEVIEIAGSVYLKETDDTYLVTEYSLNKGIDNGVNIKDVEEMAPEPATLVWEKLDKPAEYKTLKDPTPLVCFNARARGEYKTIKTIARGDKVMIYAKAKNENTGDTFLVTKYSYDKYTPNGFLESELEEYRKAPIPTPKPKPEPKPEVKPEVKPEPKPEVKPEGGEVEMKPVLPKPIYEGLRWVVALLLPTAGWVICALDNAWGWGLPVESIQTTLNVIGSALGALFLGTKLANDRK